MNIFVAFLRGINVSGQKIIKMEDLKKMFESLRYKHVTTYIQSGNVVFGSNISSSESLRKEIEKRIMKEFGFEVPVIVKTIQELEEVIKKNPYQNVRLKKDEKLHVSFLGGKPARTAVDNLSGVKD